MELFGTAFAAIIGVVLWDVVRMIFQTRYLEKRLKKDKSSTCCCCCCCPKCNDKPCEKADDK